MKIINTKNKFEISLGNMYREKALNIIEIKEIIKNPIEKVSKCELVEKDGLINYKFYLENDSHKYIGEAVFTIK